MLFKVPELTEQDLRVIERIEDAKARLRTFLHEPRRWTSVFRRSTLGRAIRGSNSIEGYVVSKADVVAAAAGEAVEGNEDTKRALAAYRRAMTYILQASRDVTFEYSAGVVKGLHFMMTEYDMDKNPGQWRPGSVFVVDEDKGQPVYEAPDAPLVGSLMTELVSGVAAEDARVPPLVRAAMAHLNLVMIHPFSDGNGRMARALQTLMLGRSGTLWPEFSSVEEYLGEHHREYYDVLAAVGGGSWHPDNDAQPWIRFSARAHYFQAHTLLRRTRESERLYTRLDEEVGKAGLPERTALALFDAASGFRVRNGTYRTVADVSEHLASRDLKALVDAGLLVAEGEKRARFYMASPKVTSIRKSIAESAPILDPYGDTIAERTAAATRTASGPSLVLRQPSSSSTGPNQPRKS
jgi:Fic family protein